MQPFDLTIEGNRVPELSDDIRHTWPMRLVVAGMFICVWLIFATSLMSPATPEGYTSPQEDAISCYPASERPIMLAAYRSREAVKKAEESFNAFWFYFVSSLPFGFWGFFGFECECRVYGRNNAFRQAGQMLLVAVPVLAALYLLRGVIILIALLPLLAVMWIVGKIRG